MWTWSLQPPIFLHNSSWWLTLPRLHNLGSPSQLAYTAMSLDLRLASDRCPSSASTARQCYRQTFLKAGGTLNTFFPPMILLASGWGWHLTLSNTWLSPTVYLQLIKQYDIMGMHNMLQNDTVTRRALDHRSIGSRWK